MPESMFVLPVRERDAAAGGVPPLRRLPAHPLELPAAEIGSNRDRWIDAWTQAVLR